MIFIEVNKNPKSKETGDCVVRAISMAEEKEWDDIYKGLCEVGFKYKIMPNDKKCYTKYLEMNGWIKCKMPRHFDNSRYTVDDFLDNYPYLKNNTMVIINVANHLTCGLKGNSLCESKLYDTWDCSYKCVGNYWIKGV